MTCGNDTTRFILDGQSVVQEELNGNTNATYLLGPRGIEYRRSADEVTRWYIYDGLGSVLGEVNEDGEIVDANDNPVPLKRYDAYGAELTNIAGTTDHKFVGSLGHTTDSNTGLIYMRARYYDPALGRFISEDPAGDGANWYVYCRNNPVNLVDSDGQMAVLGSTAALYAALAGMRGAAEGYILGYLLVGSILEKLYPDWNMNLLGMINNTFGSVIVSGAMALASKARASGHSVSLKNVRATNSLYWTVAFVVSCFYGAETALVEYWSSPEAAK